MTFETLIYDRSEGVGTVTFNRPDVLNATNDAFYRELSGLIGDIADDPEVRCVVITGAGRGFCAGADVRGMDPNRPPLSKRKRHRWILSTVLRPLVRLEKPVIAAVNGVAVGAGMNIALACDILIASEAAVFSQIFARMGLVPDLGGLHLLTRVVGLNKAKELCFTARKIAAAEALSLGIANEVVPAAELMTRARALALEIAGGPPFALSMMKTLLNMSSTATLEEMLEYEGYAQSLAYISGENAEGALAFKEKRPPRFPAAF
ncbi:MAG: 2-(1,2-epoxy,2-dihydrophenyl)acetyl-CoA isomerase [Enterovirga sp.]|jgi:2-(1,2-epoxy-1,2-dihydrophenyl)acetyl-CoA isomerase|nr:2-(1,2-epoxy,2-dihydrophenyl)acetyl-CoA isomerase [Enterovirga sp.]